MATLTSVYADSTIVLGPLATEAQPEAYDLCAKHVESFTAPRGWQVIHALLPSVRRVGPTRVGFIQRLTWPIASRASASTGRISLPSTSIAPLRMSCMKAACRASWCASTVIACSTATTSTRR